MYVCTHHMLQLLCIYSEWVHRYVHTNIEDSDCFALIALFRKHETMADMPTSQKTHPVFTQIIFTFLLRVVRTGVDRYLGEIKIDRKQSVIIGDSSRNRNVIQQQMGTFLS
jgi:hypothetical protein